VTFRFGILALLLLTASAHGHPVAPEDRNAAQLRRQRLIATLGNEYALLFAQPFTDVSQPRQHGDFVYLTSVREPGGLLLLAGQKTPGFDSGAGAGTPERALLYLPTLGARARQFMALDFAPDATTRERLGLSLRALPRRHRPFAVVLATLLPKDATLRLPRYRSGDDSLVRERKTNLLAALRRARPDIKIADLDPLTAPMRAIKDATELAHLRQAIAITVGAFEAAVPEIRAQGSEAAIDGAMLGFIRRRGAYPAFPFVIGSGRDAARPHYFLNRKPLPANSLVVIDAGAAVERYAADITRTFPISGRFSARQRTVYDAVLQAQRAAIGTVRPGVTLNEVHKAAKQVLDELQLGAYFIHGTSHHVGLDAHDPTPAGPLAAGMTITVEPGVYILAERIGVRIEDIVLVTEDGCEVLTNALPTKASAVERFLARKRVSAK